jgi:hypothetical protein
MGLSGIKKASEMRLSTETVEGRREISEREWRREDEDEGSAGAVRT